jgi:hypothetical protein
MRFGFRVPSFKKRFSARTSLTRAVRAKVRLPKGSRMITDPKQAIDDAVYNRTTKAACFIATAVYGSADANEVMVLRQFRDSVLQKSLPGRLFIRVYYAVSPRILWLFQHPFLRKNTRRVLDQIVRRIQK